MRTKGLILACFIFCFRCEAQEYPYVHYTPKDGLINSRVRKAYQDSRGKMYFATYGGLSVFDGSRFKNYNVQSGLLSDMVNDVIELAPDSLLVAVNTTGLNQLVHGRIAKVPLRGPLPTINQFLRSGNTLFLSTDEGLYQLIGTNVIDLPAMNPQTGERVRYLGSMTSYKHYVIFSINDLRDKRGLYVYDTNKKRVVDSQDFVVQDLQADRTGLTWVSTGNTIYNLDTVALSRGTIRLCKPYFLNASQTKMPAGSMAFNRYNIPVVLSNSKQVVRFSEDGKTTFISLPEPSSPAVQTLFVDRENILWICNEGTGIYKLPNTYLQTSRSIDTENQSGIDWVQSLDSDGDCIVMNDGEWLFSTKSKIVRIRPRNHRLALPILVHKDTVYAVDGKQLLIGNLSRHNGSFELTPIWTVADTSGFGGQALIDPYGNLIAFESTAILVFRGTRLLHSYPISFFDLVQGLYVDRQRRLRVVNRGSGLSIYSLHPDDPAHYLKKEKQFLAEFEKSSPRCMAVDARETMWIGTRDHGLLAFDFDNGQLVKRRHFRTSNGLSDNFVTAVAIDSAGNIIVGTQTGIDRLTKLPDNAFRIENITRSNNIFTFIKNVWVDASNMVFALSNNGLLYQLEPPQPAGSIPEPALYIEDVRVNGKAITMHGNGIRLSYDQRNISLSVAAPTFLDEQQVRFTYRLEGGSNNDWSDTSSIADFSLLNLEPGNYTLHVKAFFPSTVYSPKQTALTFSILPPWWQTWWARMLGVTLLAAAIIVFVRFYYRRKLEIQKATLEKKQAIEKERTRIATDMHDDLGAGLSRIKFLSETIGIKKQTHQPIEEDISKIREYSHEMIDKMGEIVWALNEKNDSVSDLLAYTRSYSVEYLSQHGIACAVVLPEDMPASFVSGETRRNIFLAVKEILHNVVKHSQATTVTIAMRTRPDLVITIEDNGTGFDQSSVRPYSNGLENIRKRISDIGGEAEIVAEKGTLVKLSIPLPL